MTSFHSVAALFLPFAVVVAACGGADADVVCEQQQECAEKAGVSFSVTECKEDYRKAREQADTQGCSSEYDDAVSCAADIELECSDYADNGFAKKLVAECGAKLESLNKCAGDGNDDTATPPASGTNDVCAQQAECAQKAGTAFGIDECRQSSSNSREVAATEGCSSEYAAAEACVANVEFECSDFSGEGASQKAAERCGDAVQIYQACKTK